MNPWINPPDLKTLSHMYRSAGHYGLKTTYYLRSLGASNIEKVTVGVKKEMRGAVGEASSGGQNSGDVHRSHSVEQMKADAAQLQPSLRANRQYAGTKRQPVRLKGSGKFGLNRERHETHEMVGESGMCDGRGRLEVFRGWPG